MHDLQTDNPDMVNTLMQRLLRWNLTTVCLPRPPMKKTPPPNPPPRWKNERTTFTESFSHSIDRNAIPGIEACVSMAPPPLQVPTIHKKGDTNGTKHANATDCWSPWLPAPGN